eukprot:scaffold4211_cov200-Skeletonema_dohrnii-CCMP3373.AAC.3
MLEPCQRCFYTIMASYNGLLEARVELAAVSDASSGHPRRCDDADATNKCLSRVKDASILSWPAIMGY